MALIEISSINTIYYTTKIISKDIIPLYLVFINLLKKLLKTKSIEK